MNGKGKIYFMKQATVIFRLKPWRMKPCKPSPLPDNWICDPLWKENNYKDHPDMWVVHIPKILSSGDQVIRERFPVIYFVN